MELVDDGSILDDVEEKYIKTWAEGTLDLENESKTGEKNDMKSLDKWVAVFKMANNYMKHRKLNHTIPSANSILALDKVSPLEKLENILGKEIIQDFRQSFDRVDRHHDREITIDDALIGYDDLGARISQHELRNWLKSHTSKISLTLSDYIIAYANLIFPVDTNFQGLLKEDNNVVLGKTLRLTSDKRDLASFAHKFGMKLLHQLEKAFDTLATHISGENLSLIHI